MKSPRIVAAVVLGAGLGVGMGLGAAVAAPLAPPAAQADAEGGIVDFELLPPELAVAVGDTVSWTNNGERPHTVTDRGGMFDTDPILPGDSADVTFDVPGTYEIFCRINSSSMNATVVVEAGDEPAPAFRIQAFDENREDESRRFDPDELEVASGTQLILANVGGLPHSLVIADADQATAIIAPGAEQGRFPGTNDSVKVEEAGTFEFFCEIHPQEMRGTLVVTEDQVEGRAPPPPEDDEAAPAEATAAAEDFAFDPSETVVAPGATITWENVGDAPHTATFDELELDTGRIDPGESAQLTAPDQPGTYSYFCAIHPAQMRAALLVDVPDQGADDDEDDSGGDDGERGADAAVGGDGDDTSDGTVFAYVLATLVVGVGVVGLGLGLRRR